VQNISELPKSPKKRFNFFLSVHKSIVSPDFYCEVVGFSIRKIFLFVMQLCLITGLIAGFASTYYALDREKGLPTVISELLPGMSIKNGVLDPGRATPYFPSAPYVFSLFKLLSSSSDMADFSADSFIVVDTSAAPSRPGAVNSVVLSARDLEIQSGVFRPIKISYKKIFPLSDTIIFTPDGVEKLLKSYRISLIANFCVQQGILNFGLFFMSISFLTLAAYIFRTHRQRSIGFFLKQSCFAITPVFLGTNLFSMAGLHLGGFWYLLLAASAFILLRGIRSCHDAA
jgi:hypothetical protein